ncbi:MAG: RimK-like ATPgrasp N-terminal domain-containing protein [Candidatus Bathycorpusculaceae bacterium]
MLVVSNIDLPTNVPIVNPSTFLGSSIKDFIININNDYRYLKMGYYVSVHAETLGNPVIPPSENMIDANRTPVFLLRASKAGLPTTPYKVTDSVKQMISEIGFPMVIFAVNPFICDGFKIAWNRSSLYRAMKSLSMNYKFAVCAVPLRGEMFSFKSIFGKCELEGEAGEVSERVYEVFEIPICKLHVQLVEEKVYLCSLQPVKKEELTSSDFRLISEEISLMSRHGDPVIV